MDMKAITVEVSKLSLKPGAADDGDREYTLRTFGAVQTVQQGPYDHWCAMIAAAPEVKP